MTQTLDVAGRLSQLDSAHAVEAPAAATQTRSKVGTFAITFGIAATLLYTVFERLNWPLFTYLPRVNRVEFWFLMESQRLQHPVLRDFYREREAAAEEYRQRIEGNPQGKLLLEVLAAA